MFSHGLAVACVLYGKYYGLTSSQGSCNQYEATA